MYQILHLHSGPKKSGDFTRIELSIVVAIPAQVTYDPTHGTIIDIRRIGPGLAALTPR